MEYVNAFDPNRIVSGISTIPPQLILTQVCGYWRSMALEACYLSTKLTGKGQVTEHFIRAIIPWANRWRRLLLIEQVLEAPFFEHWVYVFHNAPKLHSFDCGVVFDPESDHQNTFSFLSILPDSYPQQITHLAMNGGAYVPSSFGSLCFLEVYSQTLVSLPVKLRSLSAIASHPDDVELFLDQLTLPVLEIFEITLRKEYSLPASCARSSFVLKELAIHNETSAPNLNTFLRAQGSLKQLTLSSLLSCELQHAADWLSNPSALPSLQQLHILGSQIRRGSEDPLDPFQNLQLLDIQMTKRRRSKVCTMMKRRHHKILWIQVWISTCIYGSLIVGQRFDWRHSLNNVLQLMVGMYLSLRSRCIRGKLSILVHGLRILKIYVCILSVFVLVFF
ncbi:hypothetical protein F5050DRAFT_1903124 [Lentinula boryana]|uniref:F-box domain-containing protein n=1 Tax=Lentinula boryana TaxID=40481 RepID=A0ABQ8QBU4_9AGAR|nr:hypothetical protein F5050DRAFT_1903124 [Lentinula boryana]